MSVGAGFLSCYPSFLTHTRGEMWGFLPAFAMLVVGSKITCKVPGITVPFTQQTLALHLNTVLWTPPSCIFAIVLFSGLAFCGIPVGAPDAKNTQGYLGAFILATCVEVLLLRWLPTIVAFLVGDALILYLGAWYYVSRVPSAKMKDLIEPFVGPDLLKCLAASWILAVIQHVF